MFLVFEQYKQFSNFFNIDGPNFNFLFYWYCFLCFSKTKKREYSTVKLPQELQNTVSNIPRCKESLLNVLLFFLLLQIKQIQIYFVGKRSTELQTDGVELLQGARLVPGQGSYLPWLLVWDSSFQQASPTHP